jgi:hypothetical protein
MKNNCNLLTYFLTNSLFLGGGLSIIFLYSKKDATIAAFLGTILGIGLIYLLYKVNKSSILSNSKFLNILFKIFYFIYILVIIFIMLISLSTFLYSYYLPFTPAIISCLPFVILATFSNSSKMKNVLYVAIPLFAISIVLGLLKPALLISEQDINNILPFFSTDTINIFKSSIIYAVVSTSPYLLLINEDITYKKSLKYYLISSIINIIQILSVALVLGDLASIFSYPEYSVLRRIKILDFIENIENFVSITWFFDIFITLSVASIKLKETINTQNKYFSLFITTIILLIIYYTISNNFINSMIIYKIFPIIIGVILIILLSITFIYNRTRKKSTS